MPASKKKEVAPSGQGAVRVFVARGVLVEAKKAKIKKSELWKVATEWVEKGVGGDPLGGGAVKVRLRNGDMRAIFVEGREVRVLYAYLFNKQDEKNVADDTLKGLKMLAKSFRDMAPEKLDAMLQAGSIVEVFSK